MPRSDVFLCRISIAKFYSDFTQKITWTYRDLESLKNPQITSEQHAELIEKVNQMNILRESNSVLRDETQRASEERDAGNRKIRELELKLVRREDEFKEQLAKKDMEHKKQLDETLKAKSQLEDEVSFILTNLYPIFM